jgi:hypothetical protein
MDQVMRSCFKLLLGASIIMLMISLAAADESLQLKQLRNNAPAELLSTAELKALDDPLFKIVLAEHADKTSLKEVEELLQPDPTKRRLFVVDENIADPQPGQSRRAVIAFKGVNPSTGEVLDSNVFLSVFFDSTEFPDRPTAIEALGWDSRRGRYNFYKMDRSPDLRFSWKIRGSSVDADLLNPIERRDTCLNCHVNGGPVMKEFAFPWNNWHSSKFVASYLTTDWPVKNSARLRNLATAEEFETEFIRGAIEQFNTRRINAMLLRREDDGNVQVDAQGRAKVLDGKRLLRHLFVTTEVNFVSSDQLSGMHPLAPHEPGEPPGVVQIPDSFFLNTNLVAGGGTTGYLGLGISEARDFSDAASLSPDEYKHLINEFEPKLAGRVGDANFAWFVPGPSQMDNSMVDRLMRRGILTSRFVAAALAIDLEHPIFSSARESLLRFIPDKFQFLPTPANSNTDLLTDLVIQNVRASNPATGSVEDEFLSLLADPDPVMRLRERVQAYLQRIQTLLGDQTTRQAELTRLFSRAIECRRAVKEHPVLDALDETGDRLLPIP